MILFNMVSNLVPNSSLEEITQSVHFNLFFSLTILSLNVQGLNSNKKRSLIFNSLSKQKYDIICLQETHAPIHACNLWSKEWEDLTGGKSYFPKSQSSSSAGVAFLFNKDFSFQEHSKMSDQDRHIASKCITHKSMYLQVINIYGPSFNKELFYDNLDEYILHVFL